MNLELQEENPTHEDIQKRGGKGEEGITATSHPCSSDPGIPSSLSSFRKLNHTIYLAGLSLALPIVINGNKVVFPMALTYSPVLLDTRRDKALI